MSEQKQVKVVEPEVVEGTTTTSIEKAWSWKNLDGTTVRLGIAAVKKFFCPTATDLEAAAFIAFCRSKRLDPFANEVFLIKYDPRAPARIVVSRDTLIRRAQLSEAGYLGFKSGVIVARANKTLLDEFANLEREILYDENIPEEQRFAIAKKVHALAEKVAKEYPEILELEGAFVPEGYKLVGGWCTVFFKEREPVTAKVMLSEYSKEQASWKTMPATMIVKVAEAHAHRKAAPSYNAALYTHEELGTAPVAEVKEVQVQDLEEVQGDEG